MESFVPVLRFMVCSDVHIKDNSCIEEERFQKAIRTAYKLSKSNELYKSLDAVYVVGDFATSGTEIQMKKVKSIIDRAQEDENTEFVLTMASHEFHNKDGVKGACKLFKEIFNTPVDRHLVINGFHFISVTPSERCDFNEEKVEFSARELKKAREDSPKKPVFFFQHPHVSDTVYGSINWGEDALYSTLMNYPQVIDFSGHSHAPINDPRSIHQKHFTSLGTGSLSYFELDEFDKIYGTCPPKKEECAQMLIVEADENGRVRIYPYDLISDKYFKYTWKIDKPYDTESFIYTDERYKTLDAPFFEDDAKIDISNITEKGFTLTFPQANGGKELYADDYKIVIKEKETGLIVKQTAIWSEYYFYNMPEKLSITYDDLKSSTEYEILIYANSFWKTTSKPIKEKAKTNSAK